MPTQLLERRFATIGARLKVADGPRLGMPAIDVRADRRGEYFELRYPGRGQTVDLEVVDAWPGGRHLLLLVRDGEEKSKFLLGHDERHWFVAAVPEAARGVSGVATAMEALQPDEVRRLVARRRPKDPFRRKNVAYVRQGEWFFVKAARLVPPAAEVLHNEPLTRGHGKAHWLELAYRQGGEVVYVSERYPQGLSQRSFDALSERIRRSQSWRQMVRDAAVFAKGAIRHPDHATIRLPVWHRVLMNTEQQARAMRHVAFLD